MNIPTRMLTIVIIQLIANRAGAARNDSVATTVYVSPHFEVRDHDEPVNRSKLSGRRTQRGG